MYRAWATKRRMQLVMLDESDGGGPRPYRALIAISGYAAYRILSPESGLHVYETPRPTDGFARSSVRVRVVPQPAEYAGDDRRALRRQAIESFRAEPTTGLGIVRRYRAKPRPWVRDRVRGWRSSRLDRILAGDFDLILDAPER
jgi:ATP-dependent Clp protease ATP-binding subunit ClpC